LLFRRKKPSLDRADSQQIAQTWKSNESLLHRSVQNPKSRPISRIFYIRSVQLNIPHTLDSDQFTGGVSGMTCHSAMHASESARARVRILTCPEMALMLSYVTSLVVCELGFRWILLYRVQCVPPAWRCGSSKHGIVALVHTTLASVLNSSPNPSIQHPKTSFLVKLHPGAWFAGWLNLSGDSFKSALHAINNFALAVLFRSIKRITIPNSGHHQGTYDHRPSTNPVYLRRLNLKPAAATSRRKCAKGNSWLAHFQAT
jgi:hypothetical protein